MKRRLLSIVLGLALVLGSFGIQAKAADTKVNVTIANGNLELVNYAVTVTDTDNDGKLTINDALYLAHEAKYTGGAAAGYGSAVGQYGLGLTKLWGVENNGGYGYYVNKIAANGLADEVKNGDTIVAFVYQDTEGWSDEYTYFDKQNVSAKSGEEFTLTLSGLGHDENWSPVVEPIANATILIDGVATAYKTDANGKVTITLTKNATISAKAPEGKIIVPPVAIATVSGSVPVTGDSSAPVFAGILAAACVLVVVVRRKNAYEA